MDEEAVVVESPQESYNITRASRNNMRIHNQLEVRGK
jgi:hypothetical protein